MTAREHALQLLARAGEEDRRWILQQLSSPARDRLTPPAAPIESPDSQTTPVPEDLIARLETADASMMMELLHNEPGWLISALLRMHSWPWAKKLVERLPSPRRAEVMYLERLHWSLPAPALEFAMRQFAQRVPERERAPTRQSTFESLLLRFRKRRER